MGGARPLRPPSLLRPFRAFAPNLTLPSHFAVGWSAWGEFAFHAAGRGLTPPFSFPIARGRADRATSVSNSIFVALLSLSFAVTYFVPRRVQVSHSEPIILPSLCEGRCARARPDGENDSPDRPFPFPLFAQLVDRPTSPPTDRSIPPNRVRREAT